MLQKKACIRSLFRPRCYSSVLGYKQKDKLVLKTVPFHSAPRKLRDSRLRTLDLSFIRNWQKKVSLQQWAYLVRLVWMEVVRYGVLATTSSPKSLLNFSFFHGLFSTNLFWADLFWRPFPSEEAPSQTLGPWHRGPECSRGTWDPTEGPLDSYPTHFPELWKFLTAAIFWRLRERCFDFEKRIDQSFYIRSTFLIIHSKWIGTNT